MRLLTGVLLIVLVNGASAPASAQGLEYGVKGGANLATLTSDETPAQDFGFRIGIVAGVYAKRAFGRRLDVQPEVLFSQEGASVTAASVDATIKIDYLRVPVLARYRLSSSGRGFLVYAGPSLGIKLRAESVAEFGGQKVKTDISDDIETFDLGLAFGAAYDAGRWSVDGRYTWGFSNLTADPDDPNKVRHRVITGLVGVRF